MRQIGYVGKSRFQAAQRVLPEALSLWRAHWCFGGRDVASVLALTAEAMADASITATDWRAAVTLNGSLWLGSCGPSCWHRLVFGEHAEDAPVDELGDYLIGQAQLALANTLLEALQQTPIDTMVAESPIVTACSSRLLLTIPGNEADIFILLDASLLDAYLPIPEAKIPLLNRQQAIASARLKLKLTLPLSAISVADLSDLHLGDVLKTATPLSQPFHLTTNQDALLAKGFLVRAHTKLAIQLTEH